MRARIRAISYYLPPRALTNDELNRLFPEWSVDRIAQKTGITERRIAADDVCASDLAVESARRLFAEHHVDPADIDFLLLCTQSPDYFLPTTACLLQARLGLRDTTGALDFNLGCSGFVYGLSLARGLIHTGDARNVLLITAETYSKFLHPGDKSVRTIFGDGAAATLVSAAPEGPGEGGPQGAGSPGIGPFIFGTDGTGAEELIVRTGGLRHPRRGPAPDEADDSGNVRSADSLYMNGGEIFHFTMRRVPEAVAALLARAGLGEEQIDLYVFHQANRYLLEALRRKLGLPRERFYEHLSLCGNTVSSTIPIALAEALREGRVGPGARVMLVGFGVGYSWACCLAEL